ncbi:hypothetical protein [Paraliobacillus salinarum]|uniref:hypothetical protein n=1 Tax=Paraliobacillus salinarum TaxID=1158996 RepID=UPI0015F6211A|nr:hypothetical protein [Paraliobacillus salinarum]
MSIYSSLGLPSTRTSSMHETQTKSPPLKVGQILTGKVKEIYPNQKALIQLGDRQVVAQLKTALNLNDNYWFQVQSTDQLVHLKVLLDQPGKQSLEQQAANLLKQLQLPLTKENIQFVQKLIQSNIPFNPNSLSEALSLTQGDTKDSRAFLLNMMAKQLPITSTIYQSLMHAENNTLQQQLNHVYQQLQTNSQGAVDYKTLLSRLEGMFFEMNSNNEKIPVLQTIKQQLNQKDQVMLQVMKHAGLVSNQQTMTQIEGINNQLQSVVAQHGESYVSKTLGELFSKQLGLTDQQLSQFQKLVKALVSTNQTNESMVKANQQLQAFLDNHHLSARLTSLFPENQRTDFSNWRMSPTQDNTASILTMLRSIADQQLPNQMMNKLLELLTVTKDTGLNTKDQFLLQMKHFLNFSGILDENQILKNDATELRQNFSLKQLLVQAMQTSITTGDLEKLVHTLNGIQISSVQEDGAFIQASIQLPGFFGTDKNIIINMDSKKNQKNQIDPNYCHIVFYLSLEKIGDTCIDMSIINRKINMTIYNEYEEIIPLLNQLEPTLQKGLESKEYQLLSIKFKPMSEEVEQQLLETKHYQVSSVGVDFRV